MNAFARRLLKLCLQPAFLFRVGYRACLQDIKAIVEEHQGEELATSIAPIWGNKKGIMTIISDDGVFETGAVLNELSKKYGIPITVGGTVTNIGIHKKWWLKTLYENPLLEIVNHSYNHVRMGSKDAISNHRFRLFHEIQHSKRWFESVFEKQQICFVCPENQMSNLGYQIINECGILAVRKGERGFNEIPLNEGKEPGNIYNLKCKGIMDVTGNEAKEKRREWVETAIAEGKWLIEMWHNVCDIDDGGYQTILKSDAEEHLLDIVKYIDAGDLWCAKITDVVKYFYESKTCTASAYYDGGRIVVSLHCNKLLDLNTFNLPLTVCVRLPNSIDSISMNIKPGQAEAIYYDIKKHSVL